MVSFNRSKDPNYKDKSLFSSGTQSFIAPARERDWGSYYIRRPITGWLQRFGSMFACITFFAIPLVLAIAVMLPNSGSRTAIRASGGKHLRTNHAGQQSVQAAGLGIKTKIKNISAANPAKTYAKKLGVTDVSGGASKKLAVPVHEVIYSVLTDFPRPEFRAQTPDEGELSSAERILKHMRSTTHHSFEYLSRNRNNPIMWKQSPTDKNPSPEHWRLTRERDYVHRGEYSVRLKTRGYPVNVVTRELVPINQQFAYELSGYFRTRNARNDIVSIEIAWYADNKPGSKPLSISTCEYEDPLDENGVRKSEQEWIRASTIVNDLPVAARYARFIIGLRGTDVEALVYFDDVSIEHRPKIAFMDDKGKGLKTVLIGEDKPVNVKVLYYGLEKKDKYVRILNVVDFEGREIMARPVGDSSAPLYSLRKDKMVGGMSEEAESFELIFQPSTGEKKPKLFGMYYIDLKVFSSVEKDEKSLVAHARKALARIPRRRERGPMEEIFGISVNDYPEKDRFDMMVSTLAGISVYWMKMAAWTTDITGEQLDIKTLPIDNLMQALREKSVLPHNRDMTVILNDIPEIITGEGGLLKMERLFKKGAPAWPNMVSKFHTMRAPDFYFWQIAMDGTNLNAKAVDGDAYNAFKKILQVADNNYVVPVNIGFLKEIPDNARFKYASIFVPAEYKQGVAKTNAKKTMLDISDTFPDRFAFSGSTLAMYNDLEELLEGDEPNKKLNRSIWISLGLKNVGAPEIGGKKMSLQSIIDGEREQAIDMIKKMLITKLFEASRVSPQKYLDRWAGLLKSDLTPRASYIAYRTFAKYLTEGRYIGKLKIFGTTEDNKIVPISNFVFEREFHKDCFIIMWSDETLLKQVRGIPETKDPKKRLFYNLGTGSNQKGIEFVDYMGNPYVVPIDARGKHLIDNIGLEPILIRGLDPGLVKTRMTLDFKQGTVIYSKKEEQPIEVVVKNKFLDRAITVQARLLFPGRWRVEPAKIMKTGINPEETATFKFMVQPYYRDSIGLKEAVISLTIDQMGGRGSRSLIEETRTLNLRSALTAEVPDISGDPSQGEIIIVQTLTLPKTKSGPAELHNLVVSAKIPRADGMGYYEKLAPIIDKIVAGQSQKIYYKVKWDERLRDKTIFLRVHERNGSFFLNQEVPLRKMIVQRERHIKKEYDY